MKDRKKLNQSFGMMALLAFIGLLAASAVITEHLIAGEAIVEVVDKWHYGRNDSYEPAEIVVFYAGIVGQPITVKQLGSFYPAPFP